MSIPRVDIHIQRSYDRDHVLFWSTSGALKRTLKSTVYSQPRASSWCYGLRTNIHKHECLLTYSRVDVYGLVYGICIYIFVCVYINHNSARAGCTYYIRICQSPRYMPRYMPHIWCIYALVVSIRLYMDLCIHLEIWQWPFYSVCTSQICLGLPPTVYFNDIWPVHIYGGYVYITWTYVWYME
jgi:hypothetical protein